VVVRAAGDERVIAITEAGEAWLHGTTRGAPAREGFSS
jgi:hypothetical protein